jgi:outer membrane protein OmpA-like peptidoglycan-associated protein
MGHLHRRHFGRIAIAASGIALMLSGAASAQTVQMFDDAPSVEQLRSIMVPEAQPGASRSIVIQRPDTAAPAANVQRVATQVMPAARAPAATADTAAQPVEQVAASVPASHPSPATEVNAAKPTAAGFRINFAFNSAVLPDSAHAMIDVVAQVMKESPEIKVRVEGHTDAVGSADYNVSLSERRALSVGEYLVKVGVDPSRLMLIGKGMAEPLTSNRYDPANRRVQFVRVG